MAEVPIAQLTTLTANLNRDEKKRKRPFAVRDFCLYGSIEEAALPPAAAGAAMLKLIREKRFPSFALFVYDQLKSAGADAPVPGRCAFVASSCIVLAPYRKSLQQWAGFVIVEAAAQGKVLDFQDDEGATWRLRVPVLGDAAGVLAAEDSLLPIVEAPSEEHYDALPPLQSSGSSQG